MIGMDHHAVVDRFVAACRSDERVVAATLLGSHARGEADEYSDIDLGVVTTDDELDDFMADRDRFVRSFGKPLQVEDFDLPNIVFAIFSDGSQVELLFGRESDFELEGPYRVLLDRTGVLGRQSSAAKPLAQAERSETVRRVIDWFWHDVAHFITAIGRGQKWWAYGQLEELRRACLNLARLRYEPSGEATGYEKVDKSLGEERLEPFAATICSLDPAAMVQAAEAIVGLYRELAPDLAAAHDLPYPVELDRLISARLRPLSDAYLAPKSSAAELMQ